MVRELRERTKAVVFLVALAVAIAGLVAYVQASQPAPVPRELVRDATLVVETPSWSLHYRANATWNNTVYLLLMEAADQLHFPVEVLWYTAPRAVYVTAINGTATGSGPAGAGWQYWVDGVYGDVGADQRQLSSGDTVLWNFTVNMGG